VPSRGATNSSLKCKRVKLLTHTPFTQSLKQSVPIYFPLKSWPALVPVDRNHIGHRGRGCVTLDILQGSDGPLQRISPCRLLILTTLGASYLSGYLAQISVFTPPVQGPSSWLCSLLQLSRRRTQNHIGGAHFPNPGTLAGCRAREWGPVTQHGSEV
jgi:hypothetical protein